jgi:CRISPR-associated endonuclease Csn1
MYEHEFDAIRKAQQPHHPGLTDADWISLKDHIFYQRDLKPQEPGRCQLDSHYFRAPRALPCYQKFTIAQDFTNLKIIHPDRSKHHLTNEQRDLLWKKLNRQKTLTFGSIKTHLKLGDDFEFNLETDRRKELKGNATACLLSKKEYFGERWYDLEDDLQDEIVNDLLNIENKEPLIEKAINGWGLNGDAAHKLAQLGPEDFLPGYGRFSKEILQGLFPLMKNGGFQYDKAVSLLGYNHSDQYSNEVKRELEYYGKLLPEAVMGTRPEEKHPEKKYGKIGNPTVHIGLNQLRKVVNEIIQRYGPPEEIIVELVRDLKLNQKRKDELAKEQWANQKDNERIAEELGKIPVENNRENRIKYKLWEELNKNPNDRYCPYSGERINPTKLFSNEVEIEHILPESVTLDNSLANKTVSMTYANRLKGNRSPHEAFGHSPAGYDFEGILDRARRMPGNKKWRFQTDAMDRFKDENKFLDRQLNDTAYLSKTAKNYLSHICDAKKIWVVPGRLTAYIRERLGLNTVLDKRGIKNRDDHRHHAIDALVAGLTDRGLLQNVRTDNKGAIEKVKIKEPWENFWKSVKDKVDGIIVSHRPDHGIQGALHEATAYRKLEHPTPWEKEEGFNVVCRKALTQLSAKEIKAVRDPDLREQLMKETDGLTGKALVNTLGTFSERTGIKRVRVLKKENPLEEVRHPKKNPRFSKWYAPGEIHHVSFWKLPDGGIEACGVNFFDANQKGPNELRPHPAAKLILKVHKGDYLKLMDKREEKITRVISLRVVNRQLRLVGHKEAGNFDKRKKEGETLEEVFLGFSAKTLKEKQVRKIFVDSLGTIHDPGPVL